MLLTVIKHFRLKLIGISMMCPKCSKKLSFLQENMISNVSYADTIAEK